MLKPGGIFVSEVPHGQCLLVDIVRKTGMDPKRILMGEQHIVLYSTKAYVELHERNGFQQVDLQTNGLDCDTIFKENGINVSDKILAAISLSRDKGVYICNVLKCRPPDNRDPLPSEIEKCEPYLKEQINLIKPKLIVALGRVAAKTLLNNDLALKDMRSIKHDYYGTPLVATYHPAALLRNQKLKPAAWEDFKWIRNLIN